MTWFIQQWAFWLLFSFGMLAFLGLFAADLRRVGISNGLIAQLLVMLTLAILIGERASWVGRFRSDYAERGLSEILSFWRGGMDSSGGILAALLTVVVFCSYHGIRLATLCDAGTAGAGWVIGISRMGCFIEGDDWGIPTDSFLGVQFARHQVAFKEQVALGLIPPDAAHSLRVHPTQLYLSVLGFLLAFVFTFVLRDRPFRQGIRTGIFLLAYGLGRFLLEFLRGDVSRGMLYMLSIPQWTMLGLCVLGIGFLVRALNYPIGYSKTTMP